VTIGSAVPLAHIIAKQLTGILRRDYKIVICGAAEIAVAWGGRGSRYRTLSLMGYSSLLWEPKFHRCRTCRISSRQSVFARVGGLVKVCRAVEKL
jgi:hypothetical protein